MKKKMKWLAALAAALTLGFAVCGNGTETEYVEKQDTSTYTITFHANADDAAGGNGERERYGGKHGTLTPNGFSREGYDFAAWATSAGGAKA